jgi:hypothetical protein
MRRLRGLGWVAALAAACGPSVGDGEAAGDATTLVAATGDATTGGVSASGAAEVTTSPDVGDTTGATCPPIKCEACSPECVLEISCEGGDPRCDCICPATDDGPGPPPDSCVATIACNLVEAQDVPFVDCGEVTIGDSDAAWALAHDCVQQAFEAGANFKVLAEVVGFKDNHGGAWIGRALVGPYEVQRLEEFPGAPELDAIVCDPVTFDPSCVPSAGNLCIGCEGRAPPRSYICLVD